MYQIVRLASIAHLSRKRFSQQFMPRTRTSPDHFSRPCHRQAGGSFLSGHAMGTRTPMGRKAAAAAAAGAPGFLWWFAARSHRAMRIIFAWELFQQGGAGGSAGRLLLN